MNKIISSIIFCTITVIGYSQTTYDWLDTAPDNNWSQGLPGARWSGDFFDAPPFGILRFNNNHELIMNNNAVDYNTHQIIFGSSNTGERILSGNSLNLFDFGGANPKIENYSTASQTINLDLTGDDNGDILEINPIDGDLIINGNINNNGSFIDIYGSNEHSLIITGVLSGSGGLTLKQNSTITLTDANTFSGNTTLEAGALILQGNLSNSEVTVKDGATLIIDQIDINIKSLIVDVGGSVRVSKANSLIITENLINNGDLTLESDSDEYSSLIVNGTITGLAIYKRHVNTTASTTGNDLISAPVYGQAFNEFVNNNSNIVSDPNSDLVLFGRFDKSTDTYELWTETQNTALEAGVGYRAASTNNDTFNFTGTISNGNVSANSINSNLDISEWNLIGNPYTSYIDPIDFLTTNATKLNPFNIAVYGYDGVASNGWVTLNYLTGNEINLTPGQGFFIAIDEAPSQLIDFTPSMRRTSGGDDFIPGDDNGTGESASLKLLLNNGSQSYETDLFFNDFSTLGLDPGYDAGVYGNNAVSFSIYSRLVENPSDVDITIQSLPYANINDIIVPLGINATATQTITVAIQNSTMPTDTNIYLEDTTNNTLTLLNSENFTLDITETINTIGRFFLRFTSETLSINQFANNTISIYNNNSDNLIQINGDIGQNGRAKIYDTQGRLILDRKLNNYHNSIDSSLLNGIYIVYLESNKVSMSKKIIVR